MIFFTNVGHDYASKILKSKYDAKHYLHLNKIKRTKSIFITPSDTEEIRQILGKHKCKNSSGHDELSCRLLKAIGESIAEPLCKFWKRLCIIDCTHFFKRIRCFMKTSMVLENNAVQSMQ